MADIRRRENMFKEKFDALKNLYVYVVHELKVVRILVRVANVGKDWISGVSDDGVSITAQVSDVRDSEKAAREILQSIIDAERAKLDAAEQDGLTL